MGSLELDIVKMRMRCPWVDVWLALRLAAGGDEQ